MISMREARLHPEFNYPAWLAMIEAKETNAKQTFIYTLLTNDLIDLNWQVSGLDAVQLAIKSKLDLLSTIIAFLSLKVFKMKRPTNFYLEYADSPEVIAAHNPFYHEVLLRRLSLISEQELEVI